MVSVRSGEKGEKSTHVGSSNNPVWDDPGVIPRLGTVRYHFRLDIPYQISAHRRDIAGTPETKVVDAVEGDEARLGALVDIGADGGELGGVGVRGAVGVGGSHLRPCEGGEGEEGREEGEGEHGCGGWKGLVGGSGEGNGEQGRGESYIRARPPSISRLGRANAETSEAGTHLDRKPHGELQRRRCLVLLTWRVQRPRASHRAHTLCMPRCTSPLPSNLYPATQNARQELQPPPHFNPHKHTPSRYVMPPTYITPPPPAGRDTQRHFASPRFSRHAFQP